MVVVTFHFFCKLFHFSGNKMILANIQKYGSSYFKLESQQLVIVLPTFSTATTTIGHRSSYLFNSNNNRSSLYLPFQQQQQLVIKTPTFSRGTVSTAKRISDPTLQNGKNNRYLTPSRVQQSRYSHKSSRRGRLHMQFFVTGLEHGVV